VDCLAVASKPASRESEALHCLLEEAQQAEADQSWDFAACLYQEALGLSPANGELLLRAGNAFWFSDQPAESLKIYRKAAQILPEMAGPYLGLGNALRDLNRFEEADRAFRTCRSLSDHPLGATNHASLLLGLECYPEAFELAERRFDIPGYEGHRTPTPVGGPALPRALLLGDTLEQRKASDPAAPECVVVWTEQGLGDILQYLRWIPLLHQRLSPRGVALVLEVEASLERLVKHAFAQLNPALCVRSKGAVEDEGKQTANIGLLSLPHWLGGAPCPGQPHSKTEYLRPAGWRERPWLERPPRIGITWASGKKSSSAFQLREYRKRSLDQSSLDRLVRGLHDLGCEVLALQQGPDSERVENCNVPLAGRLDPQGDFADTAEWIHSTDLVISVDTSVAHLTGAVGHPGWILLPWSADPRWLRDRSDTPWYSSLRLFRQPGSGEWEPVIEAVLQAARKQFTPISTSWV
jgi:tetratricopeptide (TPR) repeat protein